MNALVRKEIRICLPAWLAAMLLACLPLWLLWPGHVFGAGIVPFWLGLLLLSITPFGQELNFGTFSVLLSQPISRQRLWAAKVTVLAVGLLLVFAAFAAVSHFRVEAMVENMKSTVWRSASSRSRMDPFFLNAITEMRTSAYRTIYLFGGLSVLAAFSGGLWTTLLFRQVSIAFWFTFLVPVCFGLILARVLGNFSDYIIEILLCLFLSTYSVLGFLWAKRLFLVADDVQWTGGMVVLPVWRRAAARTTPKRGQKRRPFRALLRKEIQIQHINLLLAGGLLVLHGVAMLVRRLNSDYFVVHQSLGQILEMVPVLWLAMPLLVGSVAIAEERRLGTLESLLSLPANRRVQFIVKFAVGLSLGILLGGVAPILIERVGNLVSSHGRTAQVFADSSFLLYAAAGIAFLSLYASTLTRSTIQALGCSLVTNAVTWLLIGAAFGASNIKEIVLWQGPLVGMITGPVMLLILFLLSYANYKCLQPDRRRWLSNISTSFLSLVGCAVVTTFIYHRAWEAWLPEEPTHHYTSESMAASGRSHVAEARIRATLFRIAAVLPDGRLWLRQKPAEYDKVKNNGRTEIVPRERDSWHEGFVGSSDWRDVAVSHIGGYAIKADGTLWDLSEVRPARKGQASSAKQVGEGRDWQKLSGGWDHFCALKSDGSLWEWGHKPTASKQNGLLFKDVTVPSRVGMDGDWTEVSDGLQASVAVKTDRSIWRWGHVASVGTDGSLAHWTAEQPVKWLQLSGRKVASLSYNGVTLAIVGDDGSLWIGFNQVFFPKAVGNELLRWGNDSDWAEVDFLQGSGAIGVKKDGSLWQWDQIGRTSTSNSLVLASPSRASHYFDWITACQDGTAFLALARDGALCLWGDRDDMFGPWRDDPGKLLMRSRIQATRIAQFFK